MVTGFGKMTLKIKTITHANDASVLVQSKDDMIERIT